MAIKAVLFDLDGTLLPMDQEQFMKLYFGGLVKKLAPHGYDPEKLVDSIWAGTKAMIKNNGEKTNEEVFWNCFCNLFGEASRKDEPIFDDFYRNEFSAAKVACGFAPKAKELVEGLKNQGLTLILATNPLFPPIATETRIGWAGLSPDDFVLYTTYDNSSYCKPNPKYYEEILSKTGFLPEECLMIGNDATEDMIAETLGMKVFLLTDCLLNTKNVEITRYPQGNFDDLRRYIDTLL